MLKEKEQKLLVGFFDMVMGIYRKRIENHIKDPKKRAELLDRKFRHIFGTYDDLIGLGIYDKQRIGKAIKNLESHGLVFVKTYGQMILEGADPFSRGRDALKEFKKDRRVADKKAKLLRKKNEKIIEGLKKSGIPTDNIRIHVWTKKDFPDPRTKIVVMTYKGHELVDILKESFQ